MLLASPPHATENDPASHDQGDQRQHVEQEGTKKGPERRVGYKPVESVGSSPAQGKPHDEFRQETRDDDACYPNGGMAVEVAEQNHHVIAERG